MCTFMLFKTLGSNSLSSSLVHPTPQGRPKPRGKVSGDPHPLRRWSSVPGWCYRSPRGARKLKEGAADSEGRELRASHPIFQPGSSPCSRVILYRLVILYTIQLPHMQNEDNRPFPMASWEDFIK